MILDGINTLKTEEFNAYIEVKPQYQRREPSKSIFRKYSIKNRINECVRDMKVFEFPTIMLVHHSLKESFEEGKTIENEIEE